MSAGHRQTDAAAALRREHAREEQPGGDLDSLSGSASSRSAATPRVGTTPGTARPRVDEVLVADQAAGHRSGGVDVLGVGAQESDPLGVAPLSARPPPPSASGAGRGRRRQQILPRARYPDDARVLPRSSPGDGACAAIQRSPGRETRGLERPQLNGRRPAPGTVHGGRASGTLLQSGARRTPPQADHEHTRRHVPQPRSGDGPASDLDTRPASRQPASAATRPSRLRASVTAATWSARWPPGTPLAPGMTGTRATCTSTRRMATRSASAAAHRTTAAAPGDRPTPQTRH
jgi:hypothetical protein